MDFLEIVDASITIGDLLSAVVTLFLGLYVGATFQSNNSKQQQTKDLLISKAEEIKTALAAIDETIVNPTYDLTTITSLLKKYAIHVIDLQEITEEIGGRYKDAGVFIGLGSDFKLLKNLTSYTSRTETPEISIKNSQVTISQARRADARATIERLNTHFFKLKYKLIIS